MKTKEQVVEEMCMTMRHDFGLDKLHGEVCSGMDEGDRRVLRTEMRQLIEHHGYDIARLFVMV